MNTTTPEAATPLPLKGAEARGSKPICVGLDGPRSGRVLRPRGLQGTLADRQSRIRGVRLAIALLAAIVAGGCAMPQPWVKPYEREQLADPIMRFSRDALAAKHSEHVRDIREASRGATGVQGGGCGCK